MNTQSNASRIIILLIFVIGILVLSGVYVLELVSSRTVADPSPFILEASDAAVPTRLPLNSVILAEDVVIEPPSSATDYNPIRLEIESAEIDIPVLAVSLNSFGHVVTPVDAGGYWIASSQLDVTGNIVIVGHNQDTDTPVFHNITEVELGDELVLTDQLAQEYQFIVDDIQIVQVQGAANDEANRVVELMQEQPADEQIVTMVSCFPTVECPDRIVVRASLSAE